MLGTQAAHAQSASGNQVLNWVLIALAAVLGILAVIAVTDNMLQIEANKSGAAKRGNFSLFPSFSEFKKAKLPSFADRSKSHVLKNGHDINLEGSIVDDGIHASHVNRFAVKPTDWRGIRPIPKMTVAEGDEVAAGDELFFDKDHPAVKFVAPVSGEVIAINRGEKRAITEVVILADKDQKYRAVPSIDVDNASREELVSFIQEYGGWTLIDQRPFNILAQDIVPDNIFISGFDSAPLAPDVAKTIAGRSEDFEAGIRLLNRLTEGTVYLGLNARKGADSAPVFERVSGVEKHYFSGPHPSGNVGVQIHHINNIGRGEKVWTLRPADVAILGGLVRRQVYDASIVVALTGGELSQPKYVATNLGAQIGELLQGQEIADDARIISGDVLSGTHTSADGFLSAKDDQITVIKEGTDYEMFGWLLPQSARPSISNTFPNFLFKGLEFEGNTNTHGEERAFVVSGQYESMLPMDVYVQHLCRAVMANDFERMEGLGIYELSEEDVALCEFACTSKVPVTNIIRKGLDTIREQV